MSSPSSVASPTNEQQQQQDNSPNNNNDTDNVDINNNNSNTNGNKNDNNNNNNNNNSLHRDNTAHYYDDEGDRSSDDLSDDDTTKKNKNNNNVDRSSLFAMMDDYITLSDTESFNLDPNQVMISPRTGKVLRHLGLKVHHLREPTPEQVIQEMRQHKEDRRLVKDKEAIHMRLKFKIDTQRRLLAQALRAYELLVQLEPGPTGGNRHHHHHNMMNRSGTTDVLTNIDQMSYRPADPNEDIDLTPPLNQQQTSALQRQMSVTMPSFASNKRVHGGGGAPSVAATTPQPQRSSSQQSQQSGQRGGRVMTPSPGSLGSYQNRHFGARAIDELEDEDVEDAEALRHAEHVKHANLKRLEQILLKREIVRFKQEKLRDEREKQLAYEKAQEAQLRQKDRENAERQNQIQLAREAEYKRQREERQQTIVKKREEFEERTKELDFRWNARRRRVMQENRKRQKLNEMRRAAQLEIAKQSIEQKRQAAEQGQLISEILLTRRRQEQLDTSHIQIEQKAETAKYRLAEVKARGEALAEARLQKLKELEIKQKELARQQQEQRRREIEEKKERERIKMERRTQAIIIANKHTQEQKAKVEKAVEAYDRRAEELKLQQEHEVVLRKERMREVELSFDLFRERQTAAQRAKREELENLVFEKNARVDDLAQRRKARKLRRLQIRQEAEKTRVPLERDQPGPGEYEPHKVLETGREGPKFSFGVPFSSMGARQVHKNQPSPNYESSPGPAVYTGNISALSRHRRAALFARAERWKEQEQERFPTPGPGEYYHEYGGGSPSRLSEIDEATLEQRLIGNSGFELPPDEMEANSIDGDGDDDHDDDK